MSDSRERTDRLLDEIDELVDASLSRGDQSGGWQGERYDRCPKCSEAWHFLPITRTMYQMRLGSYAQDEFGQGIVDPNYKYQEDTSPILCPGSEWLGPPIGNREWGWYLRKSGRRPAPAHNRPSPTRRRSGVERRHGSCPVWRFRGPFDHWDVELNHEVQFADRPGPGRLVRPEPIGAITTATFRYTERIPIPDSVWLLANGDHVLREFWAADDHGITRHYAVMKPISFQYYEMVVHGENTRIPEYVTFETMFPIESINWWQDFWERESSPNLWAFDTDQARMAVMAVADQAAPRGLEPDYVVMDEAHTWSEEQLRRIAELPALHEAMRDTIIEMSNASGLTPEEIERLLTDEADSSGQGGTTQEAPHQDER